VAVSRSVAGRYSGSRVILPLRLPTDATHVGSGGCSGRHRSQRRVRGRFARPSLLLPPFGGNLQRLHYTSRGLEVKQKTLGPQAVGVKPSAAWFFQRIFSAQTPRYAMTYHHSPRSGVRYGERRRGRKWRTCRHLARLVMT
jgi:hypothetical protein